MITANYLKELLRKHNAKLPVKCLAFSSGKTKFVREDGKIVPKQAVDFATLLAFTAYDADNETSLYMFIGNGPLMMFKGRCFTDIKLLCDEKCTDEIPAYIRHLVWNPDKNREVN